MRRAAIEERIFYMKIKRALTIVSLVLFVCSVVGFGAVIKGKLIDINGTPQPDLKVKIEALQAKTQDVKTGADGSFIFENLTPNNWTISTIDDNWESITLQIKIANETETVNHDLIAWKGPDFKGDLAKAYQNAFTFYQNNMFPESLSELDNLFQAGQSYFKLYALKGSILFTQKNYTEALPLLKKAVELNPYESYCNQILANYAFENKQYAESIKYFEKIIFCSPMDAGLYEQIGNSYYFLENWQKAIDSYKEAIKYYGTSPAVDQAYYFMGACNLKLKNFEEALNSFEAFLKTSPTSPDAPKIKQLVDKLKEKIAADKKNTQK